MNKAQQQILELFNKNVRGKTPNLDKYNKKHSGREGHWLEKRMKVKHNADNLPDIAGYEMKKQTKGKTTFGDWSADYYIFKDEKYGINKNDFLKIFGKPNQKKAGRFSWSGEPCPTIHSYNIFGQKIEISKNNDILAIYDFRKDQRLTKVKIIPKQMQKNYLVLARWDAQSIKFKVENKFDVRGWFRCVKNPEGVYTNIVFGGPFNFEKWIAGVKKGLIFFDSGMYQGNARNYSQWRANNSYWDTLIEKEY